MTWIEEIPQLRPDDELAIAPLVTGETICIKVLITGYLVFSLTTSPHSEADLEAVIASEVINNKNY